MERMLVAAEINDFMLIGNTHQASIQSVSPGVIGALKCVSQLTLGYIAKSRTPMAANVEVPAKITIVVAEKNQRFAANRSQTIATWVGQFVTKTNADPLILENLFHFLRKNGKIDVSRAGQSPLALSTNGNAVEKWCW